MATVDKHIIPDSEKKSHLSNANQEKIYGSSSLIQSLLLYLILYISNQVQH